MNFHQVGELTLPLAPKVEEQRQISGYVSLETAKIDALVAKTEKSIELLREYRTALISAAVTGKIDVREHSMNEVEALAPMTTYLPEGQRHAR